jgi:hypothetical protein
LGAGEQVAFYHLQAIYVKDPGFAELDGGHDAANQIDCGIGHEFEALSSVLYQVIQRDLEAI